MYLYAPIVTLSAGELEARANMRDCMGRHGIFIGPLSVQVLNWFRRRANRFSTMFTLVCDKPSSLRRDDLITAAILGGVWYAHNDHLVECQYYHL
jgi:hypothetical protein